VTIESLIERTKQGEKYTLAEIRDYISPQISAKRAMEVTIRVHNSVQDLSESERICALVCALMMELI
jgi:hypothetical protein